MREPVRLLFLVILLVLPIAVHARPAADNEGHRLALVIGNGRYQSIPELKNPASDAQLISRSLRTNGFEVTLALDLNGKELRRAIRNYTSRLQASGKNAIGLLYYAGHGLQVRENNFLLPIDADIKKESDAAIEAVHLTDILNALYDAGNRMNLVILDACRDNPFRRRLQLSAEGLAGFEAPIGTLVAYSTAPGKVALDGRGDNSPYAEALPAALIQKPLPIEVALKRTREHVYERTHRAQIPWETSSLVGEFIVGGGTVSQRVPSQERLALEQSWSQRTVTRSSKQHAIIDPDGRLEFFVEWKYLGGESGATPLKGDSYADLVDYYGKSGVARSEVMKDKRRYYARWPNRRYHMFKDTLSMREIAPRLYDIFFEYSFDVENDTKRITGRGNASLLLQRHKDAYIVLREAGDVIKRDVTEKKN